MYSISKKFRDENLLSKNFVNPHNAFERFIFNELRAVYKLDNSEDHGPGVSYNLNKNDYRSPEFFNNPDVIITGCSQTYGQGVPEETSWGVQASNALNLSYVNISEPSSSTMHQIQKIFKFIKEYGKPKYIFCMFPSFARYSMPISPGLLTAKSIKHNNGRYNASNIIAQVLIDDDGFAPVHSDYFTQDRPQYLKSPYYMEDVIPPEVGYYYSFQHIHMLEQYCQDANIDLYWTTWNESDEHLIKYAINKDNEHFKRFFSIDIGEWERTKEFKYVLKLDAGCHSNDILRDMYKYHWDLGGDRNPDSGLPHMGVHLHKHIADALQDRIKNGKN